MAPFASGNFGASALIGPNSRMMRFMMPRAGRPVNRLVGALWCAASLLSAARWMALVVASEHSSTVVAEQRILAPQEQARGR